MLALGLGKTLAELDRMSSLEFGYWKQVAFEMPIAGMEFKRPPSDEDVESQLLALFPKE